MKLIVTHDRKRFLRLADTAAQALLISENGAPPPDEADRLKVWEARLPVELTDEKAMTVVKEGDRVVDYENVGIKGYLSTFGNTDRHGETVAEGAFTETLKVFKQNPVLLMDHSNRVANLVGGFTKIQEDAKGLYIEAKISNAPDLAGVRFRVVEGVLKALSIGGIWHFAPDGRTIEKVHLFEGSLVPIPANPEALVSARSLTDAEKKFVRRHGVKAFAGQWHVKEPTE